MDYINELYDVSIFIVTESGQIVYSEEFDEINDIELWQNDKPKFFMLTNDALNNEFGIDNTIFISTKWHFHVGDNGMPANVFSMKTQPSEIKKINSRHKNNKLSYQYVEMIFQADLQLTPGNKIFEDEDSALKDLNGYDNTMNAVMNVRTMLDTYNRSDDKMYGDLKNIYQYMPALLNAYKANEIFKNKNVHGFLPSLGLMMIIYYNQKKLNSIIINRLSNAYAIQLDARTHRWSHTPLWTSTQGVKGKELWFFEKQPDIYHRDYKSVDKNEYYATFQIFPIFQVVI